MNIFTPTLKALLSVSRAIHIEKQCFSSHSLWSVVAITVFMLPSCEMENRGNGQYVIRAKNLDAMRMNASNSRSPNGIFGSITGNPADQFLRAFNSRDYGTSAAMIRNGQVVPDTKLNVRKDFPGCEIWKQVLHDGKDMFAPAYPKNMAEQKAMVQVYEAILNCNFPGKREFEKGCITNGAIARNYFLLNALLDRSTNFSGITYSGFFSGSFSNTNGVLGYHCLGFANYSNESKTQIGKLVARIESAGGGSFSDFEKGIARRNQWDQSLETLACAAPLIVAYGAGKLMAATGRNMKDSLTSSSASTSSYGSTGEGSGQSSTKVTPASVTKTFTVTNDTLAYHTGDQTGASGTNTITVRGNDGTFLVRYMYNWPSSILIESGRDKTLTGKQVTIQFDGAKATYISCTSGNGKCKITGFSRQ